jgi:O-antigen/teichoic acid export membrane protein
MTEPLNVRPEAIARNSAAAFLTLLVGSVSGVVATRLLIHGFGIDRYGTWSEALAFTAYVGLLDTGLGTAITTRVAHLQKSADSVCTIVSTALALYSMLGIVAAVVSAVVAFEAPRIFHVSHQGHEAQVVFFLLGMSQVVLLVANVAVGALLGTGRFASVVIRTMLLALTITIAQVVFALVLHRAQWPAAAALLGSVLSLILVGWIAIRRVDGFHLSRSAIDSRVARELLGLGLRNTLIYVAGTIAFGSDVIIIGIMLNARAAAAYAVAAGASQFLLALATRTTDVLTPSYATLNSQEALPRAWALYKRATLMSLLVAIPLALATSVFAYGLLHLWLGAVPTGSDRILPILCATVVFQMPGYNAFILLTGAEQISSIARAAVLISTVNLLLSIAITEQFGLIGPAVGSLVSVVVFDMFIVPRVAARVCGARSWDLVHIVKFAALPLGIETGVALVLVGFQLGRGGWVVPAAAGCAGTFWIGVLLKREGRQLLADLIQAVRRRNPR